MKHIQTRKVPERIETFTEKTTCDLCHKEIEYHHFDLDEVTIKYRSGSNYPEGGCGTEQTVDVCPECWKSKLVPWFTSQGAAVSSENWDW